MSENRLKQGSSYKDLMLTASNNRRVKAYVGLPSWLRGKESTCQAGDADLIPGSGRSPGAGNDNPFQYSCLGHPVDSGAWWAAVPGVAKESDRI